MDDKKSISQLIRVSNAMYNKSDSKTQEEVFKELSEIKVEYMKLYKSIVGLQVYRELRFKKIFNEL